MVTKFGQRLFTLLFSIAAVLFAAPVVMAAEHCRQAEMLT